MGGSNPTDACRPDLGGVFCQSCLSFGDTDAAPALYIKASAHEPARCTPCTFDTTSVVGVVLLGSLLAGVPLAAWAAWCYYGGPERRRQPERDAPAAAERRMAKVWVARCVGHLHRGKLLLLRGAEVASKLLAVALAYDEVLTLQVKLKIRTSERSHPRPL